MPLALARVLLIRLENALGHASLPVCGLGAPVGAHLLIELLQADLICKRERVIRERGLDQTTQARSTPVSNTHILR